MSYLFFVVVEWGGSTPSLMVRMVELMAVLQSVHTSSPVMASNHGRSLDQHMAHLQRQRWYTGTILAVKMPIAKTLPLK